MLYAMLTATTANPFATVANPITSLFEMAFVPVLGIVTAIGAIYCIFLGLKLAKAEEPQDREKAKGALKNAIIGFVLIFVLILALNILMPNMIEWVNESIKQYNPEAGNVLDAM